MPNKSSKPNPRAEKSLRRQVESIKRKKLLAKKVVSLADFRDLVHASEPRTVLCVDDDEIMRNALKRILEGEGYRVMLAQDGLELSKALETSKLDLVLLDVNLPWVDGFELCRLIRSHRSLATVPLIMVSARSSKEDVQRGFDSGCTDYIVKPFDVGHITTTIQKALMSTPA